MRPLGIPTADDRIVQEAARMILAAIYEPVFSKHSHGFRAGHSCHTALEEIRKTWKGVKWLIEVDVRGFFDNIEHDILDRQSVVSGKSVSVGVDLGGRRLVKKK